MTQTGNARQTSYALQLPQGAVQLLFTLPNVHGDYPPEVVAQVRSLTQKRRYIFLAFPPKCGGTFIREVVGRVSGAGANFFRPGHAMGGRDVTPYLPQLVAQMLSTTGPEAFMTHAHMIAHHSNIHLLNLFGIKPVVMKRSIPDMLCSFADMVKTEGRDATGGYNWSLLCGVPTDPSFVALDDEALCDFLVYHQAPWFIQFYASWLRAEREKTIPIHWTSYDSFRLDAADTIIGVLAFYGLSERRAVVREAIGRAQANKKVLRFNRGVSGRGAAYLKPHHLDHLHRLAGGYPDIDFVAEGLLPAWSSTLHAPAPTQDDYHQPRVMHA